MNEDSHESLEVTDLRRASAPARGPAHARSPLDARLTPRQRAARRVTIAGSVLLALCVALAAVPTVRRGTAERLFGPPPTPTAPLAPGDDLFYVLPGPPWARVTLDGRSLAHPPSPGAGRPLRLARGRHVLAWQAAPFRAWRCTISVPVSGSDTCPYDRGYVRNPDVSPFWVVDFSPAMAQIPDDQWTALVAAIQAALDAERSSDVVRPGESYVGAPQSGPNLGPTAEQPLRATLSFHLLAETPATRLTVPSCAESGIFVFGCAYMGQDCRLLCGVPEPGVPAYWSVLAPVYGTWDFTTLGGRPVASDQPDSGGGALVPLQVTRDGAAWHVALAPAVPTPAYTSYSSLAPGNQPAIGLPGCTGLEATIQSGGSPLGPSSVPEYTSVTWGYARGAPPAAGCLGVATPIPPPDGSVAGPLPPAYVLQRFGIIVAANAAAQQAWPELPVADAYEQALARQLATAAT